MEPAVGTTPLYSPATPVPVLLTSHPLLRATKAGVMLQGTTLDLPHPCLLVAPLLGEVSCLRHPLDVETNSRPSITKVNDGCIVGILFCFVVCFTYVLYHLFVIPLSHLVLSHLSKWKRPWLMSGMIYPRVQRVYQTLTASQAPLDWTLIMTTQLLVVAVQHTQKTGGDTFLFVIYIC